MDNPERHLQEFIRQQYYNYSTSDETVAFDVEALIIFMRKCGWQFERSCVVAEEPEK